MKIMMLNIAILFLVTSGTLRTTYAEEPAAGKQVEQAYVAKGDKEMTAGYQLFLPKSYTATGKKLPMIFFLHGRGESNGPLSLVKKWGPPRLADLDANFPYIVVSPQCPRKEQWKDDRQQNILIGLLDEIVKKYNVDTDRIYLTGLSMGGYGSWTLAAGHPERFAAVAPICGGGKPEDAGKLKNIPIWVFHGDLDSAVSFARSKTMVDAIKKAGGKQVRFTTLEFYGHNCWSATYASPNLYAWFNRQTASANKKRAEK
jgi:predicted peptidase